MGNFGGIVAGSQLRTMAQVIQLILLPKGKCRESFYVKFVNIDNEFEIQTLNWVEFVTWA